MRTDGKEHRMTGAAPTVEDVAPEIVAEPALESLVGVVVPEALRDPVEIGDLAHRDFDDTPFWQSVPAFSRVDREEFMTASFQLRHAVTSAAEVRELLAPLVAEDFLDDVERGLHEAPMNLRLTPYLLSLVDWDASLRPTRSASSSCRWRRPACPTTRACPWTACTRRTTRPPRGWCTATRTRPCSSRWTCVRCTAASAPAATPSAAAPTPWTRRATSPRTSAGRRPSPIWPPAPRSRTSWSRAATPTMLPPRRLREILEVLLAIPHIRRIRIATKGPAVMPMKILSDTRLDRHPVRPGRRRPQAGQGGVPAHPLQQHRTRSPTSRAARWTCCSGAG